MSGALPRGAARAPAPATNTRLCAKMRRARAGAAGHLVKRHRTRHCRCSDLGHPVSNAQEARELHTSARTCTYQPCSQRAGEAPLPRRCLLLVSRWSQHRSRRRPRDAVRAVPASCRAIRRRCRRSAYWRPADRPPRGAERPRPPRGAKAARSFPPCPAPGHRADAVARGPDGDPRRDVRRQCSPARARRARAVEAVRRRAARQAVARTV